MQDNGADVDTQAQDSGADVHTQADSHLELYQWPGGVHLSSNSQQADVLDGSLDVYFHSLLPKHRLPGAFRLNSHIWKGNLHHGVDAYFDGVGRAENFGLKERIPSNLECSCHEVFFLQAAPIP